MTYTTVSNREVTFTGSLDDLRILRDRLTAAGIDPILPINHGNAWSLYFSDPEGNGLEVFWDTPWHVEQPQGKVWDASLDKDAALAWVEENFSAEAGFEAQEKSGADFVNRRS